MVQAKQTETRARLIAGARRAMTRRGIARCTTKEIANEAGVGEGTIYNHFVDKFDLCLAVVREVLPEMLWQLPDQIGRRNPRAVLIQVARDTLGAMQELIPIFSGVIGDPDLATMMRKQVAGDSGARAAFLGVDSYIRAEQAANRIGIRVDAPILTRMLVGTLFHHAYLSILLGEARLEVGEESLVEGLVDALLLSAGRPEEH